MSDDIITQLPKVFSEVVRSLAWPITLVIFAQTFRDPISKVIAQTKVLKFPGGSFSTHEFAQGLKNIERAAGTAKANDIETPAPNFTGPSFGLPDEEVLTPYEILMTAWTKLSESVTQLAKTHQGHDDLRRVRDNLDILQVRGVVSGDLADAVREAQKLRNRVRRLGEDSISVDEATSYAKLASTLSGRLSTAALQP